jgi:orotate phosphoribosyltransferase
MQDYKTDFIRFMLSAGALKFGDFTTKSGRKTPYFINTGAYKTGAQMEKLGEFYARALFEAHGLEVDNLFGPAYKGIPLAVSTVMSLNRLFGVDITYTFNRKEAKDHGEGGALVGFDYTGWKGSEVCRVVLIEDVTTAGTSVRESLPLIQKEGKAKAIGLVVSVDRMEKGSGERSALREIREEHGIRTTAIVTFKDLVAFLETEEGDTYLLSDATLLSRMRGYRELYGAE